MANNYEPIATTTLSSSAASITFSSIPATYTDLRIVSFAQTDVFDGVVTFNANFNSDTGSNYSFTRLSGDGSTATSARGANGTSLLNIGFSWSTSTSSSIFAGSIIDIFSYAGSVNKTTLSRLFGDGNGSGQTRVVVGLWRNSAAINSIVFVPSGPDNFKTGTTFTIYGIKAGA